MDARGDMIVTLDSFSKNLNKCIGGLLEIENFSSCRSDAINQARALNLPKHLIDRLVSGESATFSTALRADIQSALMWG